MQARGNPGKEFPRRAPAAVHWHNRYSTELSAGKEARTCDEVYCLRRGLSLRRLFYLYVFGIVGRRTTWFNVFMSAAYL